MSGPAPMSPPETGPDALDAVDLAVMWDRLISITDEGATALIRSSFSTLVREGFDLSVFIFDARARMIAQSTKCIPVFIGTAPDMLAHMLRRFPAERLAPGDVVVSNDPTHGTGHMFDIAVMQPVFRDGRLVAFAMSVTHLPDIGGMGFSAAATEIYHEGLRLPVWKLFDAGRRDETLLELIRLNVRTPDQVIGDILANVSCIKVLDRQLTEFMGDYALERLDALADAILAQSEGAVRRALAALPDGSFEHVVDVEAFTETRRLVCRIDKTGDSIALDFAGTGPCVGAGINVPFPYTRAMALYAVKCIAAPFIPNNDGATAAVSIAAPAGTILDALPPTPSAGRHVIGHFVVPLVFGALAGIVPDRVTAASGLMDILTLQGRRRDGADVAATFFAAGGYGALSGMDGWPTLPGSSNMGTMPIEIFEPLTDVTVVSKALRPDSGGDGEFRGGPGQDVTLRNDTGHALTVFSMANRTLYPAPGLFGGGDGALREHLINGTTVPPQGSHRLQPGDVLTLREAGGGGYGPPDRRTPELRADDLTRGFVSAPTAPRCTDNKA